MHIEAIDERDANGLYPEATFRVYDWMEFDPETGDRNHITAYEIRESNIWEVLDWVVKDRVPQPQLSEVYTVVREADDVTIVLIGTALWGTDPARRQPTLGLIRE